ncbi:uncharacterized protein PSFLO_01733 [Pseudozyma flocculosa]|uniref:Uncharacterized protein n=2 Tax=Pseudozyma flocculosa TaxID=84751 RepID=A0A5C3EW21_9BASI|nr:uncharacterized protein PSFLO_01733 [Pseudozyma flocculosa]
MKSWLAVVVVAVLASSVAVSVDALPATTYADGPTADPQALVKHVDELVDQRTDPDNQAVVCDNQPFKLEIPRKKVDLPSWSGYTCIYVFGAGQVYTHLGSMKTGTVWIRVDDTACSTDGRNIYC